MKKWFEPDILYLTKYWSDKTAKEIARELNFSESAVSSMASKLGLKKTAQKRRELHKKALLRSKYSFHHQYLDALANGDERLVGYVTRPTMLGGQAERRFQYLIPDAINANEKIKINNPDYDFLYNGLKIDVKYSSASRRLDQKSTIWSIRTYGQSDLIVAFLERERGSELEDPLVIVIPTSLAHPRKKIEVHPNGKWWKLVIEEDDLSDMLEEYARVV